MNWINTEKQLPWESGTYIVTVCFHGIKYDENSFAENAKEYFTSIAYYDDVQQIWKLSDTGDYVVDAYINALKTDYDCDEYSCIVAWKSLPEPYKE